MLDTWDVSQVCGGIDNGPAAEERGVQSPCYSLLHMGVPIQGIDW